MNEGQGHPHDSSGYGNNGTNNGADWVSGDFGWALEFNGTSDYVDCGNDASLDITDAITISAWVKSPNWRPTAVYRAIANKDTYGLYIGNTVNKILFQVKLLTDVQVYTGILDTATWYHITGTYDKNGGSDNLKMYVNGSLVESKTYTGSISSTVLKFDIGKYGNDYFNGSIKQVYIFNRALSATEILAYFNATKARYGL